MDALYLPAVPEICDAFEREVGTLGGAVTDFVESGDVLFARAVLPTVAEVRPGDRVRSGVAIRTHDTELLVHPYTYRVVCENGAIAPMVTGSRVVERVGPGAAAPLIEAVLDGMRRAVAASAAPLVFDEAVSAMRSAAERQADLMLQLIPVLVHMPPGVRASVLRAIVGRFESGRDRSVYGLANAVTSVARDTRDAETRWRLEELGGGMLARVPEPAKPVLPLLGAREVLSAGVGGNER